jgi:NAD(P)-dependent dehydrogenase (short-subunit alcohol dehydrogenase family)
MAQLDGKICLITGATDGIGRVAAERLGEMGARLVLIGRNKAKSAKVADELKARGIAVEFLYADLSSMAEIRRLATEIRGTVDRIDVLLLNAGAIFDRRETTAEGLERTFALNHMGYFLTANLLLDLVRQAAPARIVAVASEAHRGAKLDLADLQCATRYTAWRAYQRSKLMNILFVRELARRLAGSGVTVNAVHPGFVASAFGDRNGLLFRTVIGLAKRFTAITPEAGGSRLVQLASAPEFATITGKYFRNHREATPTAEARNDSLAARLWTESARIAGL